MLIMVHEHAAVLLLQHQLHRLCVLLSPVALVLLLRFRLLR